MTSSCVKVLAKYTKARDPQVLQETYKFFTKRVGINEELTLTDQGI
jgi:hypothetical protein